MGKLSNPGLTQKFSFTNHSSISITPSSSKRKKLDDEEDALDKCEKESKISPKLNVRQRKEKLEEKCRLARSAKEKSRIKKNPQKENDNMSMKDFMDELRGRFDSQDKKLDRNQSKMDLMNLKLEKLDDHSKKTEKETKDELGKIRKELAEGLVEIEDRVTENVTGKLKPKIAEIQSQAKSDINEAVHKEINEIDIPKVIETEVAKAMAKINVSERNNDDIKSSIKEEFDNLDIPSIIKDEVLQAMKKI